MTCKELTAVWFENQPNMCETDVHITWYWGAFVQPLLQLKNCTYSVFWVYVCSFYYPACTAHASCCHMWSVRLCDFFILSHKRQDFRKKKLFNMKCVFLFSLQFLSETFLILKRTEWNLARNVYCSSCKVPAILVRTKWNLNFLERFSKNSGIIFHENPCSRSRVVPFGQTDRRGDATSRFPQFREPT